MYSLHSVQWTSVIQVFLDVTLMTIRIHVMIPVISKVYHTSVTQIDQNAGARCTRGYWHIVRLC